MALYNPRPQIAWSNDNWQTYWGTCDKNDASEQLFYIASPPLTFTYQQLTTDMINVLAQIQVTTGKSNEVMQQLQVFMQLFIQTVQDHPELIARINGTGYTRSP